MRPPPARTLPTPASAHRPDRDARRSSGAALHAMHGLEPPLPIARAWPPPHPPHRCQKRASATTALRANLVPHTSGFHDANHTLPDQGLMTATPLAYRKHRRYVSSAYPGVTGIRATSERSRRHATVVASGRRVLAVYGAGVPIVSLRPMRRVGVRSRSSLGRASGDEGAGWCRVCDHAAGGPVESHDE